MYSSVAPSERAFLTPSKSPVSAAFIKRLGVKWGNGEEAQEAEEKGRSYELADPISETNPDLALFIFQCRSFFSFFPPYFLAFCSTLQQFHSRDRARSDHTSRPLTTTTLSALEIAPHF